jgi:hypothetical protein
MEQLKNVVDSGISLKRLINQLSTQKALLIQIRQMLPAPLDVQLKAVVHQDGNLTLFVSSSVWASRLRYLLPELQKQLVGEGMRPAKLRIKILHDESLITIKSKLPALPKLSTAVSQQIRETADNISDPSLQAALQRLSRNTE